MSDNFNPHYRRLSGQNVEIDKRFLCFEKKRPKGSVKKLSLNNKEGGLTKRPLDFCQKNELHILVCSRFLWYNQITKNDYH